MIDLANRLPPVRVAKAIEKFRVALDVARKKTYPSSISLLELVTGHWISRALIVVAELDVAERLKGGPQAVEELAHSVGAHAESLYRVMRMLSAIGVFSESSHRVFSLNEAARPLLKDERDSVRDFILMNGRPFHWDAWGQLGHSVRTGQPAVDHVTGKSLFDFLASHPKDGSIFDRAMTATAAQSALAVGSVFDFSRFPLIADIGGGQGLFLSSLLRKFRAVRGLLFDQRQVVATAEATLQRQGVADRVRIEAGSFFESVPSGADAYVLKNIIHDWSDELSVQILRNVRRAMGPDSRLLLVETVVPETGQYHVGKLIDLEMLVCTSGGKERTLRQFEGLFQQSSLRLVAVHPTVAFESIVEVAPI